MKVPAHVRIYDGSLKWMSVWSALRFVQQNICVSLAQAREVEIVRRAAEDLEDRVLYLEGCNEELRTQCKAK